MSFRSKNVARIKNTDPIFLTKKSKRNFEFLFEIGEKHENNSGQTFATFKNFFNESAISPIQNLT